MYKTENDVTPHDTVHGVSHKTENHEMHYQISSLIHRMNLEALFRRTRAEQDNRDIGRNLRCADELEDMVAKIEAYSGGLTLDDYLEVIEEGNDLSLLREIENELFESITFTACEPYFFYFYFVDELRMRQEDEEDPQLDEPEERASESEGMDADAEDSFVQRCEDATDLFARAMRLTQGIHGLGDVVPTPQRVAK